jgi:hypothetical protein
VTALGGKIMVSREVILQISVSIARLQFFPYVALDECLKGNDKFLLDFKQRGISGLSLMLNKE